MRAEIERFDPALPLEQAWTPPASWYVEPGFHELERQAVFDTSWQLVGRVDQVARPGDRLAGCHAGRPWVVVRGNDERLRAFVNVCRHKATQVAAEGASRGDELVCPYHGWRYALDGRLKSAPRLGAQRDFDRQAMGLVPLDLETWGPFVFVRGCGAGAGAVEGAPSSLAEQVAVLDERLALTGWERLRWVARRSYDVACNWKAFCDNYLDGGYHIEHMHPTLDAQLDMHAYRTELFERLSIQTAPAADGGDTRIDYDPRGRIGGGSLYAFIYPNLMLNRYGPVLDTNLVLPVTADRCRVVFDFFFAETDDAEARAFIERSLEQTEVTQQEDMAISASVQVGLRSGAYDRGRYAGPEAGVLHFHRLLAADLRAATG